MKTYGGVEVYLQPILNSTLEGGAEAGPHAVSYPMGVPGARSLTVTWWEREALNSPPSNADVNKGGAISPLPHVFMACAYLIKHRDDFTFFL
jgi:hypothetical protein